jgi:Zinc-binding dehydrogenase
VLAEKGTLVAVGGPAGRWLAPATRLLGAAALSPFVSQRLTPFVAKPSAADLALMQDLAEAGKIRPVIDREYALGDTAAALTYPGTGRARGKVIIKISDAKPPRPASGAPIPSVSLPSTVRRGNWKYIDDRGQYLLFDLRADPGERHDVAQQHGDVMRDLRALAAKWEADVDAEAKEHVPSDLAASPF